MSDLSVFRLKFNKYFRVLSFVFPGATFILLYFSYGTYHRDPRISSFPLYFFSSYIFYFSVYSIFQRIPDSIAAFAAPLFTTLALSLVFAHNATFKMIPIYYIVDNSGEAITTMRQAGAYVLLGSFVILYLLLIMVNRFLRKRMERFRNGYVLSHFWMKLAVSVVLLMQFLPGFPASEFPYFVRSGFDFLAIKRRTLSYNLHDSKRIASILRSVQFPAMDGFEGIRGYPFARIPLSPGVSRKSGMDGAANDHRNESSGPIQNPGEKNRRTRTRPSVFFIIMESASGQYAFKRDENGKEYTPVFNRLSAEGWRVPKFYSTSINTSRGHLSIFCGVYSSFLSKVYVHHSDLNVRCLPEILKENGYHTSFYVDMGDLNFDNTKNFVKHIGFETIHGSFDAESNSDGWSSTSDAKFYKNVFQTLGDKSDRDTPQFIVMVNSRHHWPFPNNRAETPLFSARPEVKHQLFLDSLAHQDQDLTVFFDLLKKSPYGANSLVFIIGDHSFPAGEHGNYFNENLAYEESFHTYFTVVGAGRRTVEEPTSQVDVAPTLLDLLAIESANQFAGYPLDRPLPPNRPVFASQPYDGKYLVVYRNRYKFVRHLYDGDEYLYDLLEDPMEMHPLSREGKNGEIAASMKSLLGFYDLNQAAIEKNRFFVRNYTPTRDSAVGLSGNPADGKEQR